MTYEIIWPEGFDEYAWEVESKGCLFGVKIKVGDHFLEPTFYDRVRLSQDVQSEVSQAGYFAVPSIVVLEKVTKSEVQCAVERMSKAGTLRRLAKNLQA